MSTAVTQNGLPRHFPTDAIWLNQFMQQDSFLTFSEIGTLSCVCKYLNKLSRNPKVATTAYRIWHAFLMNYEAQQTIPINSFAALTRHIFTNLNQFGILVRATPQESRTSEPYSGRELLPPLSQATDLVLVGRKGNSSSIPFENNRLLGIAYKTLFLASKQDNFLSLIAIDTKTGTARPESSEFSSYFRSTGKECRIVYVGKVYQEEVENVAQQIFTVSRNGAIDYWDAKTFKHILNIPFHLEPIYTIPRVERVHQIGRTLYVCLHANKMGDNDRTWWFVRFFDVGQNCNELEFEFRGISPGQGLYPPNYPGALYDVDSNQKMFVFYPTMRYLGTQNWITAYAREGLTVSLKWRIGPFKWVEDVRIGEKWIVVSGADKDNDNIIGFYHADSGKHFYNFQNDRAWNLEKLIGDDILLLHHSIRPTTLESLHITTQRRLPAIPINGELQHVHVESTGGERTLEMVMIADKQLQLTRYRNAEVISEIPPDRVTEVVEKMPEIDEFSKSCCERFWQWIKFVFTELMLRICICVQRVLCLKSVPCFPVSKEN